ncbi:cytochrome b561 and DOMON domain-containing protein [Senna tora]|uniref:Cytochrome b561 and DOMON domain-containing protein n=1 Tax=Senna tora TaxID=362788 RepID=A0A835CHY6_9FABA|nr:cytochrome b561 and DOMON domain-containing protein [Senna tora]
MDQVLSIFMLPKKDQGYCNSWNICHHILGYGIVVTVIANIFEGIMGVKKLKWGYVGILGVLAFITAVLEVFRYINSKRLVQYVESTSNS